MQVKKLKIQASNWAGRRVLVTGHTGFMGSWLCLVLKKLGCEVWGISLEPATNPNLFSAIQAQIDKHLIIDIRDFDKLKKNLIHQKFDFVFHLAAQPLVRQSYDTPIETFATNVMGTVHILDLVKDFLKPMACLVVTSDKCYKNEEKKFSFKEDDPLGGHDPYSASKAATEIVVDSYRKSFFEKLKIPLASVRAGNIIGGGDWSDARIIPDLMRNLLNKKAVEIRSPQAIRPWQHVLEPVFVYIGLMDAMAFSENGNEHGRAWNIGPEESSCRNVKELAELCCKNLNISAKDFLNIKSSNDLHEAQFLQIDSSLLKKTFHWRPVLDFEKTIDWTVEWYRQQHQGKDPLLLCQTQINEFLKLSLDSFNQVI